MYKILVYGSLLDKTEIKSVFSEQVNLRPVKVLDYQRTFNQSSTWRKGENGERGVLTAFPTDGRWINAILIENVSKSQFEDYTEREEGYDIKTVSSRKIIPYNISENVTEPAKIAVGKLWLESVSPIPSYKQLCLEAADSWSEEFYEDFVKTTEESVPKPTLEVDVTAGFEKDKFQDLTKK